MLHGDALHLRHILLHPEVVAPYLGGESLRPLALHGRPWHMVELVLLLQLGPPLAERGDFFLAHLAGERRAELRAPLQMLLLQHLRLPAVELLTDILLRAGLLQSLLAPRVVTVEFREGVVALHERVHPPSPLLRLLVTPVTLVGGEAFALQLLLYLLALGIVPVEHALPVLADLALVDGLHQGLVLGKHLPHVDAGLQHVLERVHLVATRHELVHVPCSIVGALRADLIAPDAGTCKPACEILTWGESAASGTFHGLAWGIVFASLFQQGITVKACPCVELTKLLLVQRCLFRVVHVIVTSCVGPYL